MPSLVYLPLTISFVSHNNMLASRSFSASCLTSRASIALLDAASTTRDTISASVIRRLHTIQDNQIHYWSILNHLHPTKIRSSKKKFASLLLNINNETKDGFKFYEYLWQSAALKVCVDGSANYLARHKLILSADVICGDFDSIDPKLLERLRCPSSETLTLLSKDGKQPTTDTRLPQIVDTPSQKETDFTKAIWVAENRRPDIDLFFALFYNDGLRPDHLLALWNTLYLIKKDIVILDIRSNNISWLLVPGVHHILKPKGREMCYVVPFGSNGPAKVTSQGLEYNMKPDYPMSFGKRISTSNICRNSCEDVVIETNRELLWSIYIQ